MKVRINYLLILLTLVSWVFAPAYAEEFKLKSGKVYEGKLIDSDNQSVYIETNSGTGLVNVPKNDLAKLPAGVSKPTKGAVLKQAWGKKEAPAHSASGANHVQRSPLAEKPSGAALAVAQKAFSADRAAMSPPNSNAKTPDGKVYGMDLMKIQHEAAQSDTAEMQEMFQKAAVQDAFHKAASHQSAEQMDLQKKLQKNPATGWAINWSLETAAKANLRKIHSAAAMFEADKNKSPQSMQELMASGMLDAEFKSAVQSYNFNIIPEKEGVMVQATPADANVGLAHFTLNPKGKIESQKS